jgi:hypothetical protein
MVRIVDDRVVVTPNALNQNRDFSVLTEYRRMLGGISKHLYSLDDTRIAHVFSERSAARIGFVVTRS